MPYKDPAKKLAAKKLWLQSERGRAWCKERYARLKKPITEEKRRKAIEACRLELESKGQVFDLRVAQTTSTESEDHKWAIKEYKSRRGCWTCGEKDPFVLGFHRFRKDRVRGKVGITLMRDLASRRVLCENCRRKERVSPAEKRYYIAVQKSLRGCSVCGEKHYLLLDFHHRDPNTKIKELSRMSNRELGIIEAELDKCDVLCANCHLKHHQEP